jgi:peptidoglycan hydrolase CwlO-like protein
VKAMNHRTIWAAAALVGALSFAAFAVTTIVDNKETEQLQDSDAEQDIDITANRKALEDIAKTLAGVEELVKYVRDVKDRAEQEGDPVDLTIFVDLLCASEDPVRLAACAKLPSDILQGG